MLDPVSAHIELIERNNVLREVVSNVIICAKLTVDRFLRCQQVSDLNIQFFAALVACKINFLIARSADSHFITPAQQLQMQCGLNWLMMLKKRNTIRTCFDGFNYEKIACYSGNDIQRIMNTEGMIHSERKIRAVIHNAMKFKGIIREYGTFDRYIWSFTGGKTYLYKKHLDGQPETRNELSDAVSKDLKRRGFQFLGSITVFSYLQSAGIINDHAESCWRFKELSTSNCVIK